MTIHLPKFPESLPPPTEIREEKSEIHLSSVDLSTTEAIEDLVNDLYWYADNHYFLFFKHGIGITPNLLQKLESHGISSKTTELYFYQRPQPMYENDFIRVLPGEAQFDWQYKAAAGQMHGRITLGLAPWRKKKIDLAYAAEVTANVIANREPTIELKPNFAGIGINLHSILRKLKTWWSKQPISDDHIK